ncbi:hypothetical protein M9H77_25108 [Catharanthus roseus]|uniref:Uncharacterized protein n=1 Tax=Catharanthus roseus TaxID=4058 RepID=A0ACC0A7T8_CATRO|nr:hypothetical protein M9H77_25108 [Catharanthus roseus]
MDPIISNYCHHLSGGLMMPNDIFWDVQVFGRKASWKICSSFSLKKETKTLPAVQINDDMDLIDEDSPLSEEDLKKPEPAVGDCEVGKTGKACKNCTSGRAEAAEKVKLGPTMEQLNNPQSACGNVFVKY